MIDLSTKNMMDLQSYLENISLLEKKLVEEAYSILSFGKMYSVDLFISSISNRATALIRGFCTLAKDNNYIAAVPIIRMQVDNCLRFYAVTLVQDHNSFFLEYLSGTHIGKIKDSTGKEMNDTYLAKKLDKIFPGIYKLYKSTSGYIHLSNEHAFLNSKIAENNGQARSMTINIGNSDFFSPERKIEFAFNMLTVSEIFILLIHTWLDEKKKMGD
jgi:hypothetical protein